VATAAEALARSRATPRQRTTLTDGERIARLTGTVPWSVEEESTRYRTPAGAAAGALLRPAQARALAHLRAAGGLLGPIGTGHGKGLLTMLAPHAVDAKRPVLLLPASMRVPYAEERVKFAPHWRIAEPRVVSYTDLSVESGADLLERLAPDLIVADEAHNLRHPESARTRRIIGYFLRHPETRFVALSGTLTKRSLADYAHLAELALRERAPVPLDRWDLAAWCRILDARGEPQSDSDWRSLAPVFPDWEQHGERRQIIARKRYSAVLTSCPGVVATSDASVSASLYLHRRPLPLEPDSPIAESLRELERTWTRPDGEELPDPLALARVGRQVSQGFYYRWAWPTGVPDLAWLSSRNRWAAWVRYTLGRALPDLDSPARVEKALRAGRLRDERGGSLLRAWDAESHKLPPPVEAVWFSDEVVQDVLRWALERVERGVGGIVWYADVAMGDRLRVCGLPVYDAGEQVPRVPDPDCPVIACSIAAHGTGKNLQAWADNLILAMPTSGDLAEQLVSRTHRAGQEADEVHVETYAHTRFFRKGLFQALADARYIEDTFGTPQRLCYATWTEGRPQEEPDALFPLHAR
jgi:hypothetical protein